MVGDGETGLEVDAAALPVLPGVEEAAGMGLLPAGLHAHADFKRPFSGFRADAVGATQAFAVERHLERQMLAGLKLEIGLEVVRDIESNTNRVARFAALRGYL